MPSELAIAGARLCKHLGGYWYGQSGICRCPAHDDRNPSLSVRAGRKALLFKCHAGCPQPLVIAAIRKCGTALSAGSTEAATYRPRRRDPKNGWAQALWHKAQPLPQTLGTQYLEARGLVVPDTAPLRFLPQCYHPASRRWLPAVLAASQDLKGEIQALHRIYLHPDKPCLSLWPPVRMLTNSPLQSAGQLAPATNILGLAEGIETALAAMQIHAVPVWATLSSKRLHCVAIPETVQTLVLFGDNDAAGRAAVARAGTSYATEHRSILSRIPDPPFNDWADCLQTA